MSHSYLPVLLIELAVWLYFNKPISKKEQKEFDNAIYEILASNRDSRLRWML